MKWGEYAHTDAQHDFEWSHLQKKLHRRLPLSVIINGGLLLPLAGTSVLFPEMGEAPGNCPL